MDYKLQYIPRYEQTCCVSGRQYIVDAHWELEISQGFAYYSLDFVKKPNKRQIRKAISKWKKAFTIVRRHYEKVVEQEQLRVIQGGAPAHMLGKGYYSA